MKSIVAAAGATLRKPLKPFWFPRLVVLPLLMLTTALQAQFDCETNNGSITITDYIGPGGDVTIPDTINGLPVTSIGYEAFSDCWSLTSVTLPASVTSIGIRAFYRCSSLTTITVDLLNPGFSSVAGVLFNKGQTTLIQCPGGKAGSYTVPNTVISIGSYAFSSCTSLTSVTIPNSVTSVGDRAFSDCWNLTSIFFEGDAPSVGVDTFLAAGRFTVYYVAGTAGWSGSTFAGHPMERWYAPASTPATRFVSKESTNPVPPFVTWETAATSIQDAVDVALPGDTVVVTNGVYAVGSRTIGQSPSRVTVTKPIKLESVNGPQVTTIDGDGEVRCVYLGMNAVLSGFTLNRGAVVTDPGYSEGGGVFCEGTSIVTNCHIVNCHALGWSTRDTWNRKYPLGYGGGAYGGTLYCCVLMANAANLVGGGASWSTLYDSTVTGNTGSSYSTNRLAYSSSGARTARPADLLLAGD